MRPRGPGDFLLVSWSHQETKRKSLCGGEEFYQENQEIISWSLGETMRPRGPKDSLLVSVCHQETKRKSLGGGGILPRDQENQEIFSWSFGETMRPRGPTDFLLVSWSHQETNRKSLGGGEEFYQETKRTKRFSLGLLVTPCDQEDQQIFSWSLGETMRPRDSSWSLGQCCIYMTQGSPGVNQITQGQIPGYPRGIRVSEKEIKRLGAISVKDS